MAKSETTATPSVFAALELLAKIANMHSDRAPDDLILWCDNVREPKTVLTLGYARAVRDALQRDDGPVGRVDAIERAICRETCAAMGEPACWSVDGSWPNKDCNAPGCHALACAAEIALQVRETLEEIDNG